MEKYIIKAKLIVDAEMLMEAEDLGEARKNARKEFRAGQFRVISTYIPEIIDIKPYNGYYKEEFDKKN